MSHVGGLPPMTTAQLFDLGRGIALARRVLRRGVEGLTADEIRECERLRVDFTTTTTTKGN